MDECHRTKSPGRGGGGTPQMKGVEMLVVSLRGEISDFDLI